MMKLERKPANERADWREKARKMGYGYFQNEDGSEAWNEKALYVLDKEAFEKIKTATETLFGMALQVVSEAMNSPSGLSRFHIPEDMQDYVRQSWFSEDIENFLIGRFDLAWNNGEIKLIEFNADTPATLPESTKVQKLWHKETRDRTETNPGLNEDLIVETLEEIMTRTSNKKIHVIPYPDNLEDATHAQYWIKWIENARGTGIHCELSDLQINKNGIFVYKGNPIKTILKMYPWELMLREDGRKNLPSCGCTILNPAWTSLLSNKHLLVALWEKYPKHPLLLKASYDRHDMTHCVRKPIHARGGENVEIIGAEKILESCAGTYGKYPTVYQEKVPTHLTPDAPVTTSIGSWVLSSNGNFGGLTFREEKGLIIKHSSPIVPCSMT